MKNEIPDCACEFRTVQRCVYRTLCSSEFARAAFHFPLDEGIWCRVKISVFFSLCFFARSAPLLSPP